MYFLIFEISEVKLFGSKQKSWSDSKPHDLWIFGKLFKFLLDTFSFFFFNTYFCSVYNEIMLCSFVSIWFW